MPKKKSIQEYLTQYEIDREYLYDAYVIRQLSLPEIKKEKGIDFKACSKLLTHFDIPVRSISESRLTCVAREKIVKSFRDKLGVDNPSQLSSVKEKKKSTFIKNYGVDNIWKSKQYYKWLDEYMLQHYGKKRISPPEFTSGQTSKKWWNSLTIDEKEERIKRILQNLHRASSKKNSLELKISEALDIAHLSYQRFFHVGRYVADFYIKQFNLIIECNGDFWHGNPNTYKEDDMLAFPNVSVKAKDLWEKDEKKLALYKSLGYNVLVMWECDIKRMYENHTLCEFLMNNIK